MCITYDQVLDILAAVDNMYSTVYANALTSTKPSKEHITTKKADSEIEFPVQPDHVVFVVAEWYGHLVSSDVSRWD